MDIKLRNGNVIRIAPRSGPSLVQLQAASSRALAQWMEARWGPGALPIPKHKGA